ncbi:MAG: bifunctional phosphoribosyl-AMP cyclohydrolase/phosphoribosyl-ATP diphosphatase HisIE [Patescibacteria group bacterium]
MRKIINNKPSSSGDSLSLLIPTIIQDINTKEILMLGYSNKESIQKTKQSGKITFYSRSKKRLWTKGETSKNYLLFKEMFYDCDKDAILMLVEPNGPTCHTGAYSCFKINPDFNFKTLEQIIKNRKSENKMTSSRRQNTSYTVKLLNDINLIRFKIIEEANEVVLENSKQRIIEESADVIYHLMVLLAKKNIFLIDIERELGKRNKKICRN